jgi:monovalent cation:H+ antiporter, CPA1 family
VIAQINDHLIEITITTVVAFGSYLLAEHLHFSGVLAVVAAGLIVGSLGPRSMSPTTRVVLNNFWDYVAFLANSLVFLLIGLQVNVPALTANWCPVVWSIVGVLIARAVVVYGLGWIGNRLGDPVPLRWLHVMNWAGLRGAICLALALSLPATMGSDRDLLRVMAFGVVLFTLLVQGTTMGPLLRRLRINVRTESQITYETEHARLMGLRAAHSRLKDLHGEGLISPHAWETLEPDLATSISAASDAVRLTLRADPVLEAAEIETAQNELRHAQRSAYLDLRRDGLLSDEVFEQLVADVDAGLVAGDQPDEPGDPADDLPPRIARLFKR